MTVEKPSDQYITNLPEQRDVYIDETWWNAHLQEHDPHELLVGSVEQMRLKQSTRYNNFRKLISIYEWGFKASFYDTQEEAPIAEYTNAWNAAQNVVETAQSIICKHSTIPMPLTSGGGYSQRRRARDLQKALEGEYDENHVDEIEEQVVLDALNCGAGFAKVFSEFGQIRIDNVPADDLTVDDSEGRYGKPRNIYQRTRMDRFEVLAMYGGNDDWLHGDQANRREKILNCKSSDMRGILNAVENDQIDVYEGWHLPSGPDTGDGRWSVCIDGCTLVDRQRNRRRFPFAMYIPRRRPRNFWGLSMMHDLACNQNEYERITRKVQKAHQKMGGSHIIAPRSAQIDSREIDNDQGTFIEYEGAIPPTVFNPDPVNPQTYQYQASIPELMMRSRGISPMTGAGEVPAGLQNASGKALQVFKDEQSGRMKPYFKAKDRFHVQLSQLIIEEARDLVEQGNSYKVRYASRKAIEAIDWSKVIMDEDEFVLKIFPISSLSEDPAAKFEQLQEMLNAGAINIEQFRRLFGLPDLEAENEIDSADVDIIDMNLDIIAMEGRYLSPEPFDNLALAKSRAGKFYNLCRARKGIPEENLELLRNYIEDCEALIKMAQQPPPGAPPPMPGGPMPGGAPPMMPGMPPGPPPPPMAPPGPPMAA